MRRVGKDKERARAKQHKERGARSFLKGLYTSKAAKREAGQAGAQIGYQLHIITALVAAALGDSFEVKGYELVIVIFIEVHAVFWP